MNVIDNVMPVVMQDQLIDICTQAEFTWSFLQDATYASADPLAQKMNKPKYPSFCHLAIMDYRPKTAISSLISSMLLCMSDKAGVDSTTLYRARFGLYLPIRDAPEYNNIHVDMPQPHTVALYYVNDSDGDTFFFDNNREVVERVTPKKGRMVVFDGLTFHASSMPSKNYRISLNLGYVQPQSRT
jgi:hypothetical protein